MRKKFLIGCFCFLPFLLLFLAAPGWGGEATLSWDGPTIMPDGTPAYGKIAGYYIHYGTASGSYSQKINAGNVVTYTVPNLLTNKTYYFVVTAYYTSEGESERSNEVSKTITKSGETPGKPHIYQIALNNNELLKVHYYLAFRGGER